jgi:hypothetical protein
VAVVVVQPDADHAERRMHSRKKIRVGVGRTVVRDFEDVGAQIDAGAEHRLLCLDLSITGKKQSHPADGGAQHDRRVVRVRAGTGVAMCRTEDVQTHRTEVEVGAECGCEQSEPPAIGDTPHRVDAGARCGQRADQDAIDTTTTHDAEQTSHMIDVEMTEYEQRDPTDAQIAKAAVDGDRVRPGIDHDRGAGADGEHFCVALPNVARDEQPPARRPRGGRRANGYQNHQRGGRRGCEDASDSGTGRGRCHHQPGPEQQQSARGTAGPRNRGAVQAAEEVANPHQPAARPASEPCEQLATG